MTALLFVYGTLRAEARHPMARWLRRRAEPCGTALFQGRLYDLGPYPGAVPSRRPEERVAGELYRLRRTADLKRLDRYEGAEYRRERVVVATAGGPRESWAYLYRGPVCFRRRIRSGDWVGPG